MKFTLTTRLQQDVSIQELYIPVAVPSVRAVIRRMCTSLAKVPFSTFTVTLTLPALSFGV